MIQDVWIKEGFCKVLCSTYCNDAPVDIPRLKNCTFIVSIYSPWIWVCDSFIVLGLFVVKGRIDGEFFLGCLMTVILVWSVSTNFHSSRSLISCRSPSKEELDAKLLALLWCSLAGAKNLVASLPRRFMSVAPFSIESYVTVCRSRSLSRGHNSVVTSFGDKSSNIFKIHDILGHPEIGLASRLSNQAWPTIKLADCDSNQRIRTLIAFVCIMLVYSYGMSEIENSASNLAVLLVWCKPDRRF